MPVYTFLHFGFRLVPPRDEVLPPFPVWELPPLLTKLIPLRAVISYASDFTHEPETIIKTDTVSQNDFTFITDFHGKNVF